MKVLRKLWSGVSAAAKSPFITSLPLYIYLLLSSLYFLTVVQLTGGVNGPPFFWVSSFLADEQALYAAELQKQKIQFAGYGFTLIVLLFQLRNYVRFSLREHTLWIIFGILLLTTLVSNNPDRVVINLAHLVFGAIAVWLYFSPRKRQKNITRSAAFIVFVSLFFVQFASVLWFIAHPEGTIDTILAGSRLGGLAGNPNTFGGICVVFVWAVLTLISTQQKHGLATLLWIVSLGVVGFNLWTAGSSSSQANVLVMVLLFLSFSIYGRLSRTIKIVLSFLVLSAVFGTVFWFVFQQNLLDVAESATGSVGKDLTFTGRLDLWLTAMEAIAERPILGWSYDNHETVFSNPTYDQRYNHFHNGFLDTLIVGGVILGLAVLYNVKQFASRFLAASLAQGAGIPLIAGAVASFMHNLTEYSMLRSNTTVWMMYFICFIAISIAAAQHGTKHVAGNNSKRGRPRFAGRPRNKDRKRYSW